MRTEGRVSHPGNGKLRKARDEGGTLALLKRRGEVGHVAPLASDAEKIRTVLGAIVSISLRDDPIDKQLRQILDLITSTPGLDVAAKGAIFLVEGAPGVLVMKAQKNLEAPQLKSCALVPFGRCLCGRAAAQAAVEFAGRVDHRHDIRFDGMKPHGHYVVPIVSAGKVRGVLCLYVAEGHVRDPKEEEFLRIIADLLAGLLTHKLTQRHLADAVVKMRKTLKETMLAVGATLEIRDPYTSGHQVRVADLACAIAIERGLSEDRVEAVRMAATIHDIGKIAVPAEILSKPSKLTEAEFELIKVHAKVGYDILRNIDFPWPIAQFVLQHHERMNGSGYPAGLCGEDILLEARIIGVADVVEAMATHRPYRLALGLEGAVAEISKNKGVLYDASVVDACLKVVARKGFAFSSAEA